MKQLGALLFLLVAWSPPVSSHAVPSVLAATNTITATGGAALDVVVPAGAQIVHRLDPPRSPAWADITTTGSWAAIVLMSKTETFNGGASIVYAFQYHTVAPNGCSGEAMPLHPRRCLAPFDQPFYNLSTPPTYDALAGVNLFSYPPGEYRLYLLTSPGATATATFTLRGAAGSLTSTASDAVRVNASITYREDASLAIAHSRSQVTFAGRGLAFMGFWHVGADPEQAAPVPFTYHECLTRGAPGPASPFDCVPAWFVDSVTVGDVPVMTRSTTWQFGTGPSLESEGLAMLASPVLEPGHYVNTANVTRGGAGPGVGTWTVWLDLQ